MALLWLRVGLVSQFSSFEVGSWKLEVGLLHSINNLVFDLPFIDNKFDIFGHHHNGDRWLCRPSPSGCGDSTQAWIASQLFVKRCWMRMGVGFGGLCMWCCVVTQGDIRHHLQPLGPLSAAQSKWLGDAFKCDIIRLCLMCRSIVLPVAFSGPS